MGRDGRHAGRVEARRVGRQSEGDVTEVCQGGTGPSGVGRDRGSAVWRGRDKLVKGWAVPAASESYACERAGCGAGGARVKPGLEESHMRRGWECARWHAVASEHTTNHEIKSRWCELSERTPTDTSRVGERVPNSV